MRKIALAALCLLLTSPALAESNDKTVGERAKSVGETTGVNSLIGVAPTTEDFVKEVAISDMFETQSSKLAEEKSDAKTKTFAQKMVADHTKTSEELKGLVTGGKVKAELPTALDSTHQSKLDTLKGLNGEDFTKQYQSDQVSAHKTAVDLFKRYADGGDNADLKAWAAKTRPHLEEHLKLAQDLQK
jgi:putative membrane protein